MRYGAKKLRDRIARNRTRADKVTNQSLEQTAGPRIAPGSIFPAAGRGPRLGHGASNFPPHNKTNYLNSQTASEPWSFQCYEVLNTRAVPYKPTPIHRAMLAKKGELCTCARRKTDKPLLSTKASPKTCTLPNCFSEKGEAAARDYSPRITSSVRGRGRLGLGHLDIRCPEGPEIVVITRPRPRAAGGTPREQYPSPARPGHAEMIAGNRVTARRPSAPE